MGTTVGSFAAVYLNTISAGDALMAKPHLFLAFRNVLRAEPCCVIGVYIVRRYMRGLHGVWRRLGGCGSYAGIAVVL